MPFTKTMMEMYDEMSAAQTGEFALQSLFKRERVYPSVKVEVEIDRDNEKVAVDVKRGANDGNANQAMVYTSKEFLPPLYNEYGVINGSQLNEKMPGMSIYDPINREANLLALTIRNQMEATKKIQRSIEIQAAQALFNGALTFKNNESIDFKRRASLSVTVGTAWSSTGKPIDDIQALGQELFKRGKMMPDTMFMKSTDFVSFINNSQVADYLDKRRIISGELAPGAKINGATYWGRISTGGLDVAIYIYDNFYDVAGTKTTFIPDGNVLLMNSNARLDKAYAATEVMPHQFYDYQDKGMPRLPVLESGKFVPYLYEHDGGLKAGVQSAPLLIPVAIDTFGVLKGVTS